VVWEKVVELERDPDDGLFLVGWSQEYDGEYVCYIIDRDIEPIIQGEEYIVTVRRRNEEED